MAVEDGRLAPLGTYISKSCYDLIDLQVNTSSCSSYGSSSNNNNIQQFTEIQQLLPVDDDTAIPSDTMIIDNNTNKYFALPTDNDLLSNTLPETAETISDRINDNKMDSKSFGQMLHVYHHFSPTNCQSKTFTVTTAADTFGGNNQSSALSKGIANPYNRVNNLVIDSNGVLICKTSQTVELTGDSLVQVPLECSLLNSAKRFYDNKISTL